VARPLALAEPVVRARRRVDELVGAGLLHPDCQVVFSAKGTGKAPAPLSLYEHQRAAIAAARAGGSYVLTTGTGSGKSLAYMVPIVDRVLRDGSGKGIRAIVVYPMNALANSQVEELDKFLRVGFEETPVRYRRQGYLSEPTSFVRAYRARVVWRGGGPS